jgi:hypothetical protein
MPVPLVDFQGGHGRFSVFLGECRGATDDNSPAFQCRVGREMVASPAGTTEFSRSCGTYGHVQTPPALKRRPIVGLSRWDGRLRRTKPRPACQNIRFPAGANVAQAFGHDAQAWAKYQCPSPSRIFKGTADDTQFSLGNVAERRMTIARHFNAGLVVKWLQVPQGRPSSAVPAGLMAMCKHPRR